MCIRGSELGGDVQFKLLIQWMAASAADRDIIYCKSNDPKLNDVEDVIQQIILKYKTIGALYSTLQSRVEKYSNVGNENGEIYVFNELLG